MEIPSVGDSKLMESHHKSGFYGQLLPIYFLCFSLNLEGGVLMPVNILRRGDVYAPRFFLS
ncbi:hypothetical protein COL87_13505 [Bacillus pseudomycoides]|nr:hypothetical protein CON94_08145 [Bacillus pseudomycoides]PEI41534.1 hypothetical protein CN641_22555 [Bacillus pseudomycoides]PEJ29220.1 hypothetical protein CN677_24940 [Bacillus pseudomycoides]PEL85808.1 hypothetical protein CN615_17595 [Bacillus pseudomycoides]PEM40365.1 hypothetical protein CN634_07050 [Bacillus pseudomycoides]